MKLYIKTGPHIRQKKLNTTKSFKPIFADMNCCLTAKKPGDGMQ